MKVSRKCYQATAIFGALSLWLSVAPAATEARPRVSPTPKARVIVATNQQI